MSEYKNIKIKMKNGKSRTQRVQVLKSGKYKFVKNPKNSKKSKKSKTSSKRKTTRKTKRRGNPNKKGGRKTANNSIRIPSLPTMAKVGVAGLWLATRQTGYGNPLAEIQSGHYASAAKALLQNARDVIMTAEGWTNVIAPIVAISLVQKIVPKTRVNILGVNWSIM